MTWSLRHQYHANRECVGQRVDKIFKATIDGSLRLQRKLWFKPTIDAELDADTETINPLLRKWCDSLNVNKLGSGVGRMISFRGIPEVTTGSWRRMLAFQRTTHGQFTLTFQNESTPRNTFHQLRRKLDASGPGGLTMGAVIDFIHNWNYKRSRIYRTHPKRITVADFRFAEEEEEADESD